MKFTHPSHIFFDPRLLLVQLLLFTNLVHAIHDHQVHNLAPFPLHLNVTAVTTANNRSILQCWQVPTPFSQSPSPGAAHAPFVPLGDVSNATFTVVPAKTDGGFHHASPGWVHFVLGLAQITLPDDTDQAWINGGKYGLMWMDDPVGRSRIGHRTVYWEESVVLVVTRDGDEPMHTVVRQGACMPEDLLGMAG